MSTDPPAGTAPPAKPLRADARRNRARILTAADEVFAASGPSASTEEVARRAGVAIGTVFRHFPAKHHLAEAVFVARLEQLVTEARDGAEADHPGPAFLSFVGRWAELSAAKLAVADALTREGLDVEAAAGDGPYPRVRAELLEAVGVLLARAQEAGAVRPELGVDEIHALLVGTARAVEQLADDEVGRARVLAVVVDGLRPPERA